MAFLLGEITGLNLDGLGFFIASKTGWGMWKMKDAGTQSYFWSGVGAVFGYLSLQEWLAVISVMIALTTMLVNSYYRRQDNRRKEDEKKRLEALHNLRLERMEIKLEKERAELKAITQATGS